MTCINYTLITHAGCIATGVGRASVCVHIFPSVCPHSWKTASAISTNLDTYTL